MPAGTVGILYPIAVIIVNSEASREFLSIRAPASGKYTFTCLKGALIVKKMIKIKNYRAQTNK